MDFIGTDDLPRYFKFRNRIMSMEDLGNYNFGVFADAYGYSMLFSRIGAGAYQIYSTTSRLKWLNIKSFGDDPRDAYMIYLGYNH